MATITSRQTPGWLTEDVTHPVEAIREGFPYDFYETFLDKLQIPEEQIARVLSVTARTLRRRRRERQRLSHKESDRLWLLAQTFELATETFGDEDRARRWLTEPHRLLDGESPIEHMDTTAGVDSVRYVLHQIDHSMPL